MVFILRGSFVNMKKSNFFDFFNNLLKIRSFLNFEKSNAFHTALAADTAGCPGDRLEAGHGDDFFASFTFSVSAAFDAQDSALDAFQLNAVVLHQSDG